MSIMFRDLIRELQQLGWVLDRKRGDHWIYKHGNTSNTLAVPAGHQELRGYLSKKILSEAKRLSRTR